MKTAISRKHDVVNFDKSAGGIRHHFGNPVIIRVRMQSGYSHVREDEAKNGVVVLIYKIFNNKHGGIEKQGLPDPYLGY